jgi:hypothetical protein
VGRAKQRAREGAQAQPWLRGRGGRFVLRLELRECARHGRQAEQLWRGAESGEEQRHRRKAKQHVARAEGNQHVRLVREQRVGVRVRAAYLRIAGARPDAQRRGRARGQHTQHARKCVSRVERWEERRRWRQWESAMQTTRRPW